MAFAEVMPYVVVGGLVVGVLVYVLPPYLDRLRRARSPHLYRRIAAQVVEVEFVDRERRNKHETFYRVILRFKSESGEAVVVDGVYDLTEEQKNVLLPERWVMIEYLKTDPEKFRIDYAVGRQGETAAAPPSAEVEEPPSLYGPKR